MAQTRPASKELPPVVTAPAPPEGYFLAPAVGRQPETALRLRKQSDEPNRITDTDEWWLVNGLPELTYPATAPPAFAPADLHGLKLLEVIRGNPALAIYGDGPHSGRELLAIDPQSGRPLFCFDFSLYTWPSSYDDAEKAFVQMGTAWAHVEGDVLYVSHSHRTYSRASNGRNAYITAIHIPDNKILWRSQPLVSNAENFLVKDDAIICGYGFSKEKDFLYVLNKKDGRVVQKIPLKTGPEYIVEHKGRVYVRTYNRNYVFDYTKGGRR